MESPILYRTYPQNGIVAVFTGSAYDVLKKARDNGLREERLDEEQLQQVRSGRMLFASSELFATHFWAAYYYAGTHEMMDVLLRRYDYHRVEWTMGIPFTSGDLDQYEANREREGVPNAQLLWDLMKAPLYQVPAMYVEEE